jgi:hypothetical protein
MILLSGVHHDIGTYSDSVSVPATDSIAYATAMILRARDRDRETRRAVSLTNR